MGCGKPFRIPFLPAVSFCRNGTATLFRGGRALADMAGSAASSSCTISAAAAADRPPLPKECHFSLTEPAVGAKDRKQPLLVFLHGWPDGIQLFESTQKHFAALGYRCASVGLPGYNEAGRREQGVGKMTFEKKADTLLEQAILHAARPGAYRRGSSSMAAPSSCPIRA